MGQEIIRLSGSQSILSKIFDTEQEMLEAAIFADEVESYYIIYTLVGWKNDIPQQLGTWVRFSNFGMLSHHPSLQHITKKFSIDCEGRAVMIATDGIITYQTISSIVIK